MGEGRGKVRSPILYCLPSPRKEIVTRNHCHFISERVFIWMHEFMILFSSLETIQVLVISPITGDSTLSAVIHHPGSLTYKESSTWITLNFQKNVGKFLKLVYHVPPFPLVHHQWTLNSYCMFCVPPFCAVCPAPLCLTPFMPYWIHPQLNKF